MSYDPSKLPVWRRLLRRVAKRLVAWRYRNFTPTGRANRMARVAGMRLLVRRGVFDPSMHFTSAVLARYLARHPDRIAGLDVLDVGTGSGVAAIAAALSGASRVVAVDINPAAAESARLNASRYELLGKIDVRLGDMFEPVRGETFAMVICNPPYFKGTPSNVAEMAYHAGPTLDWLQRFGNNLAQALKPTGSAIISVGDAADIDEILRLLHDCGWAHEVVAQRDILVEIIYLFKLTRLPGS
ncbi:MAG: methyltransferase [Chloroflexota bacterium]